ncbi:glycosyl hydrolase family 8 [Quadrisphaera sp. KR29]|uniref:glycosyl hydrolase family 8 n=1 Tax=Quadrisphaera sp. KR29 TaxID=3461391 RepID=UPI0040443E14
MSLDQLDSGAPAAPTAAGAERAGTPTRRARRRRTALRRRSLLAGAALVVAALVVVLTTLPTGGPRAAVQRIAADPAVVPAQPAMLAELWTAYKARYLEQGTGRTLDPSQGDITTSEGQSYTMMRAVWSDDRATFDTAWQWTKDNLGREDHLNAWRFGQLPDGTWGVLTESGGGNAASDADVDMAFALLMAYSRWQHDGYLYDARSLIDAVWRYEVVDVAGQPVLVANDLERNDPASVLVNPSYLAPYAFRAFARVDPAHDWEALVDSSYALLDRVTTEPLGGQQASGLAPDWVRVDRATGAVSAATDVQPAGGDSTDSGYEALRLPWRLALDARWNDEPRATALLQRQGEVLAASWESTGSLAAIHHLDGSPAVDYASAAMYGGVVGALEVASPEAAEQVYRQELEPLYDADSRAPSRDVGYYEANWSWFGAALHLHALPDLLDPQGSDLP